MKGDAIYKRALKLASQNDSNKEFVFELLMKSYNLGNYKAAYAIGTWYLFGEYVKKNFATAFTYLKYAADGGVADACIDLAVSYETGKGVKKDKHQAFIYYLKAFFLGHKKASYEVGRHYYYGLSVPKNIEIAKVWLNLTEEDKD